MKPPPRQIDTARLLLRAFEESDVEAFAEMIDDSREHYAAFIPFYVEGDPAERVARYRSHFDSGEGFVYAAFADDQMIGGGMLFPRIGPNALELGYQLRRGAVGRGYATEIAAVLRDVAFEVCGVDRVEAHIDRGNEASVAVARRLGMWHLRDEETLAIYEVTRSAVSSSSERRVTSASDSDSSSGG